MSTDTRVIGLGYKARSGKDTVADFLVRRHGYTRIAFADALKRGCMDFFGLSEDQVFGDAKFQVDEFWKMTPGEILQKVGTECMRDGFDQNIWVKRVLREIAANPSRRYVMSDVRFPNEVDAVLSVNGLAVRIDRPAHLRDASGRDDQHPSEIALDGYDRWTVSLSNASTLYDLFCKVERLLGNPLNAAAHERIASYIATFHDAA